MRPSRRSVLELAGAAGTATVLGTADPLSVRMPAVTDEDLPGYSRWLTLENGTLAFTYVDWERLSDDVQTELEAEPDAAEIPEEFEADPMIGPASDGLVDVYFFATFELVRFGLGRLLDEEAFESTVEALLEVNEAFVLAGAIEPGEIDAQLTAEPAFDFQVQFERTDEIGDYDVYAPAENDVDTAVAVGEKAVVIVADDEDEPVEDPDAALERTIGAAEGELDRATDDSESVEWLLETAGRGDVAVGQYGGPFDDEEFVHPAFESLADAEGIVSSLTVEDETTAAGTFASIVDDPDEDALEAILGSSADERSTEVDADRVTATATWLNETLQ